MTDAGGAVISGAGPAARAEAWARLGDELARDGQRGRALVAARTALALVDRVGAEGPGLEAARSRVADLTGPHVVPLHVDMGGGAEAGVDLFLVCHRADRQRAAIEALVKAVESGRIDQGRIEEANRRLDVLERKFAHPAADEVARLSSAEHQALSGGLMAAIEGKDPTEGHV